MVRHLLLISALVMSVIMNGSSAWADGVFMVVKGDVKVEKNGKQTPAKLGMKVIEADTIIAGKDSRANIVRQDKNVLNISTESKIFIEKYVSNEATNEKNVTLNVLYGKVRSTVNQKYDGEKNTFHVKTPSAVAGVRGTDFISSYQPDTKQAQFVTFEGHVEVGKMDGTGKITNAVMVNPGQTTTSEGGKPAPPSNVPKSDLAKMDSDSKSDNKNDRLPADNKQPEKNSKKDGGDKSSDKSDKPDKKDDSGDKKQDGDRRGADRGNGQRQSRAPASLPAAPAPGPAGGGCMFCDAAGGGMMGGETAGTGPAPTMPGGSLLPPPSLYQPPKFDNLVDPNLIQQRTKLSISIIYK